MSILGPTLAQYLPLMLSSAINDESLSTVTTWTRSLVIFQSTNLVPTVRGVIMMVECAAIQEQVYSPWLQTLIGSRININPQ